MEDVRLGRKKRFATYFPTFAGAALGQLLIGRNATRTALFVTANDAGVQVMIAADGGGIPNMPIWQATTAELSARFIIEELGSAITNEWYVRTNGVGNALFVTEVYLVEE